MAFGLICIAIALYYGLEKIAEAIGERHKSINVTLPPIYVRYGEPPEQDAAPQVTGKNHEARNEMRSPAAAAPDEDMCPNCITPWKCNGPHIS